MSAMGRLGEPPPHQMLLSGPDPEADRELWVPRRRRRRGPAWPRLLRQRRRRRRRSNLSSRHRSMSGMARPREPPPHQTLLALVSPPLQLPPPPPRRWCTTSTPRSPTPSPVRVIPPLLSSPASRARRQRFHSSARSTLSAFAPSLDPQSSP